MKGRTSIIAAASAAGLLLTGSSLAAASHGQPTRHSPRVDHFYVIMLENHSQSSVIGDPNAPYISSLADSYAVADHYYGVTHPSMPNYIAAIAGDNFGIQDDHDKNVVNLDRPNLVDQLEAANVRWGAYMEDLPADKLASYAPSQANALYAKKHNPFVLFDSVKNDPSRMAKVKDYSALATDLNRPDAPQFVWISPNQCNDMHGGIYSTLDGHPETPCPYGGEVRLKQNADTFVEGAVSTIMSSKAWTKKSAIVILTDENDYTGNPTTGGWESAEGCCDSPYVGKGDLRVSEEWPGGTYGGGLIPAIVVTGWGPQHRVVSTPYNHYSLLTTIEDNWDLPYLGHAGDSAGGVLPMWPAFGPGKAPRS